MRQHLAAHGLTMPPASGDIEPGSDIHTSTCNDTHRIPCREQRQLNALVRQHLAAHGLKLTALTLSEEAAGNFPPAEDDGQEGQASLLSIWRGQQEAADAYKVAEVRQG